MYFESRDKNAFYNYLDKIGLKAAILKNPSILIKVNAARPPEVGHPRTDAHIVSQVIKYVSLNGGTCCIAEGANGFLKENLEDIGLGIILDRHKVEVIDIDAEETEAVSIEDETHYIPTCFLKYGVRIGIPATSKRPDAIFSNNVKLFVGAVPRRMYQIGDTQVSWRPKIHEDLHKSVANLYSAIQKYSPFHFYINGGTAMDERIGEFQLKQILVGDNAVELDRFILEHIYHMEEPEYIRRLSGK